MSNSLKRMLTTLPKIYQPGFNPVITALLEALAESDDEISTQINNAKDQLFVRTATGRDLDRLSNSLGVSRPQSLGLSDEDYQELIPNLSLKPKQIKKAFYDTADVFWGPMFSRANISSTNFAPFGVATGDIFEVVIDSGETQRIKALPGDILVNGAATAEEILTILSRIKGATVEIIEDSITGNQQINIRTNTPGSVGSVEILASTMVGVSKLDFEVRSYDILDLTQRVSVYNITPNELLIEIPAIVPSLRRTLKGSHHFHLDSTLEGPEPTENGIWAGSFLFNPDASGGAFTITSQRAVLGQTINKGEIYTALTVSGAGSIENQSGFLIANFGQSTQEVPIRYRGIPNTNTILIDPSYLWKNNHFSGEYLNVISAQRPYTPNRDGSDLAVYLTSPSGARAVVENILDKLKAAGIVITFVVLAPKYKYILDNPYLTSDDAPSI